MARPRAETVQPLVPFADALRVWVRVAIHSFGGPAGQIAYMHRVLVEEKQWISERRFLHSLNYCMILPGPEAMQLATYVGWLLHGTRGGLVAGALFVLPGFLAILLLSLAYATYQDATWLAALFFGLKAAVLAVVADAVLRLGRRALRNAVLVLLAAGAFAAIFFFAVPFPFIVVAAALTGWLWGRRRPQLFESAAAVGGPSLLADDAPSESPRRGRTLKVVSVWLALWWGPLILLLALLGRGHIFVQEGLFFSSVAMFTFGGAYAVLAYVAQRAVEDFGWLLPGEMLDGLGMAETTPGPLIQVVQFVGFMGAYRDPGGLDPVTAAIVASVIVTWVTFVPCFLWIFAGAPYIEHLRDRRALTHALGAVTAAVVGVILNLAVWFGLHVLFTDLAPRSWGPLQLLVPDPATLDVAALAIAAGAFLLLRRWPMLGVLALATVVGAVYRLV